MTADRDSLCKILPSTTVMVKWCR